MFRSGRSRLRTIFGNLQTPYTPGGGTGDPTATPSPNGTKISSASASPIIDQAGSQLHSVESASKGLQIACNGFVDPVTAQVVLLGTLGGKMVQANSFGDWFSKIRPQRSMVAYRCALPSRRRDRNRPATPSLDGTKITTAAASPIIDQAGNKLDPRPVSVEGTADRLQRCRRPGHRAGRPAPTLWVAKSSRLNHGDWSSQNQAPPVHGRRSLRLAHRYCHRSPSAPAPTAWSSRSARMPMPTVMAPAMPRAMPRSRYPSTASRSVARYSGRQSRRRSGADRHAQRQLRSRHTFRLGQVPERCLRRLSRRQRRRGTYGCDLCCETAVSRKDKAGE